MKQNRQLAIYLDDLRPLPEGFDVLYQTGEELISYLNAHKRLHINKISFDHDLGEDIMTGYDVVKELVELIADGWVTVDEFYFHTANPTGYNNMVKYLQGARKHGVIPDTVFISTQFKGF